MRAAALCSFAFFSVPCQPRLLLIVLCDFLLSPLHSLARRSSTLAFRFGRLTAGSRVRNGAALCLAIGLTTLLGFLFAVLVGTRCAVIWLGHFSSRCRFCLGLFSVLCTAIMSRAASGNALLCRSCPIFLLGFVLLVMAIEGLICILMAAPIALALALLGGSLGFAIQGIHWGRKHTTALLSVAILLTPSSSVLNIL